jgi:hypothetical protein
MNIGNMPTLTQVCVWELPFPPASVTADASGSPNVEYTTSCGTSNQRNSIVINEMNVYPNPANDVVYINLSVADNYILEITDIAGKRMYYDANYHNNNEIHLTTYSKGVYLFKVQNGVETVISKLLIQ